MDFEKLPALNRREEDEPGYEKESWKPTWKCYCCHDTGFVLDRLAALVIEGYDAEKSKIPRCNASDCDAEVGENLENSGTLDFRLSAEICDRLSQMERESWEDYRWKNHQLRKEALGLVEDLAEKKSVRVVKRSAEEEKSAHQKHLQVVENY